MVTAPNHWCPVFTWQANYDDKQRIQFENKFEWKLGFITSPGDTLHSYTPNNDLLRLKTKFGYKAITHWYYTLSVDFETQLFSTYETNTNNLVSAFFSPAKLNVGLGMDYKYTKGGCNLSVMVNPLNYSLYAVASDRVDPTRFNIKEGHKTENEFGSRLEANMMKFQLQNCNVQEWCNELPYLVQMRSEGYYTSGASSQCGQCNHTHGCQPHSHK